MGHKTKVPRLFCSYAFSIIPAAQVDLCLFICNFPRHFDRPIHARCPLYTLLDWICSFLISHGTFSNEHFPWLDRFMSIHVTFHAHFAFCAPLDGRMYVGFAMLHPLGAHIQLSFHTVRVLQMGVQSDSIEQETMFNIEVFLNEVPAAAAWVEVLHSIMHTTDYLRCPCKGHGVGCLWLFLLKPKT